MPLDVMAIFQKEFAIPGASRFSGEEQDSNPQNSIVAARVNNSVFLTSYCHRFSSKMRQMRHGQALCQSRLMHPNQATMTPLLQHRNVNLSPRAKADWSQTV